MVENSIENSILDSINCKLLNLMQEDFPISIRPWAELAEKLDISEKEVLVRVVRLKEAGIIRRVGGILNTSNMNFISCLCAVTVPNEKIMKFVEILNRCPGITHNYEREDEKNIWFTLTAPNNEALNMQIAKWEQEMNLNILRFPTGKMYKRKVSFKMEQE